MFKLLFTFLFILTVTTFAHAEHGPYYAIDDVKKFNRGAINIVSSPLEIPKRIKHQLDNSPEHPVLKGTRIIGGTMEGVLFTLGRAGSGLWDIATFNLQIPKNYEPLMKPDFIYQTKADKEAGTGTHKIN